MADEFDIIFNHHPPRPEQIPKYTELRRTARDFAFLIEASCPDCRERSLAITKLEEALMWANAAVARRT